MQTETDKLNRKIDENRMKYEQVIHKLRDEKCNFEEA